MTGQSLNQLTSVQPSFQVKLVTPGTPVQFPDHFYINGFVIIMGPGSSGTLCIGDSTVNNTIDGTGKCATLIAPGDKSSYGPGRSGAVWLDGTNAGDWVGVMGS